MEPDEFNEYLRPLTYKDRMPSPTLEEAKDKVRAEVNYRSARLGDELDKLIKLITWARECLDNELMSGLGHKKMGISDKDVLKIKNLAATMNSAVEAKIRYDKAQKQLAESMTPEEEYQAVVSYIKSLTPEIGQKLRDATRRVGGWNGHPSPQEDS